MNYAWIVYWCREVIANPNWILKNKNLTQRQLWSNPTWWCTWNFKTDASQRRLRHKTTLWFLHNIVLCLNQRGLVPSYVSNSTNHNVGFFVLTDIVVFNTTSVLLTDVMINVSWVNIDSIPDEKCLSKLTMKTLFVLVVNNIFVIFIFKFIY